MHGIPAGSVAARPLAEEVPGRLGKPGCPAGLRKEARARVDQNPALRCPPTGGKGQHPRHGAV